ncbi:MAG: hypothetical protein JWM28_4378 [Chitinophagaceae bacterium]|nr:hypothetical protein [Chitinophagaceae bacterium]
MKWNLLMAAALLSLSTFSQKSKITWGDEFRLRRGSTDLEVIYADKSGVYLQEGHLAVRSYFVIGGTTRASATLVKLDKNLTELYRSDFNRELKGKEFVQFFVVQDRMFVFASDYEKREKTLTIFGAEVNKNSGELSGDWIMITSFQKEEKKDDINFKLALNADSSKMVVISSIEGREKNEYTIQEFDKTLKPTAKPVTITNEFDPKTFQLEDVLYTLNKKKILVGRIYEYQEGKKKKDKFLDFANYNIRLYDEKGKQQKEINTNVNGRWLNSTKLVQEKNNDVVLAAFFSNQRRGKTIDGMLVQRINPVSGEVITTSEKQINHSLLTGDPDPSDEESDEKESRAERKERERLDKIIDEGDAFSKYMRFQNIFYTNDDGLIVVAEKYHHYIYTLRSYASGTGTSPARWTSTTYSVYECGDLLMCKIDKAGNIGWMRVLPKAQREVIQIGYSTGFGFPGYFDPSNRPFYAGFGTLQTNNAIQILFNDNPRNATVTQPGQKIKSVRHFGKSDCFIIKVDVADGKAERRMFFTNADVPTSMPRLGSVIGEDMYIIGKDDRMFGKSKIAVAKVTMN